MKKLFLLLMFLSFCFLIKVNAKTFLSDNILEPKDVTTKNFNSKLGQLKPESIYKLCTFDYCDYMRSVDIKECLEIFTINYLNTIDNEELRASLAVKGVKITKVILESK